MSVIREKMDNVYTSPWVGNRAAVSIDGAGRD